MACNGERPGRKSRDDGDNAEPAGSDPRSDGPIVRRLDARAAAALEVIAKQLGIPVERFYGSPSGAGSKPAVGEATRREQEQRLLRAFRRMSDTTLREDFVDLADALASEP